MAKTDNKNNTPSTEVKEINGKKYEIAKNPLADKFGNIGFNKETEEKIIKVSHLSPFKKQLIVGAMTRAYNNSIWDGKGTEPKSLNFKKFDEILKVLNISEEQYKELMYEYKQKDKIFSNQSDNLVALFEFVLPKDLNEYDTEQRSIALLEAINKAYLKLFGSRVKYTLASAKASDLSLLGDFNATKLGVNPRDSLKKVSENNPNAINHIFEEMINKEILKPKDNQDKD